jgi:uroporphyrinogen-III synthase
VPEARSAHHVAAMEVTDAGLLANRGIVVTRPAHQATPLAEMIRAAGGHPLLFPVIEIADIEDSGPLNRLVDRLDEVDWAIFVSPNAVYKALTLIKARRALPAKLRYAAVGLGSVRELATFGVTEVVAPARFDSEALLALPEFDNVTGKRIVTFRGVGGRDLLGEALVARGAHLEYAECYRRVLPRADPSSLLAAWRTNALSAVTVTSSEGLRNFCTLIGEAGRAWLNKTPLFVPHARIAATARELNLNLVVHTAQGDGGLLAGLQQWFSAHR